MDFMSDSMVGNRKFRTLNVMDDCSREVLAIEIDTSLSSKRVIRTLERIIEQRGMPIAIRTDNGPEFTSKDLELWSLDKGSISSSYNQVSQCRTDILNDLTGSTEKQCWTLICSLI